MLRRRKAVVGFGAMPLIRQIVSHSQWLHVRRAAIGWGRWMFAALLMPLAAGTTAAQPTQAGEPQRLPCVMVQQDAFEPVSDCALRRPDGGFTIAAPVLRRLQFDRKGLAPIIIAGEGYAYVRPTGAALVVATIDNGPDDFVDGLARVRIGGKIGYANRRLQIIVPAIYDGAYPFVKGRARVCVGCVAVSDGEHSFYQGGTGLCIDQRGRTRPNAECH